MIITSANAIQMFCNFSYLTSVIFRSVERSNCRFYLVAVNWRISCSLLITNYIFYRWNCR